ncbi:hypothetical protein [Chamaesiphon sp.]|uniref:hypothetical protein n=1 Tax=Chamaesiphon sp. TaxID=2814140 RepID=UPI0035933AFB
MNINSILSKLSADDLYQNAESKCLQNSKGLEYLKNKQELWSNISKLIGVGGAGAAFFNPPLAIGGAAASLKALGITVSFERLALIVEMLLRDYPGEITITPKVKTDAGEIELLVRTSDGMFFAFESRSKGTSRIKWREDRQNFFINSRTKKGKPRSQKWGELISVGTRLNQAVLTLKKQKNEIIGKNKAEQKRPVIKAIILTGKTEIDPNNDPAMFVDFGKLKKKEGKVLRVATENVIFLVNQQNLVDFLMPRDKNL